MTEKLKGFTATPVIVERVPLLARLFGHKSIGHDYNEEGHTVVTMIYWRKHYYVVKTEFIKHLPCTFTPEHIMVFEDDLE